MRVYVAPIAVCADGHVVAEGEGEWRDAAVCKNPRCDSLVVVGDNYCGTCAYPQKSRS